MTIKVTVYCSAGRVYESLELLEGTTAASLLCYLGYNDWNDLGVVVNKTEVFADHVLSNGDSIFISSSISGAALVEAEEQGIKELQEFTAGAENLIIIDRYILQPNNLTDYIDRLSKCTNLTSKSLKRIHLIYPSWLHKSDVMKEFCDRCRRFQCTLSYKHSNNIHDRIWIKDGREALSVGTSLNGLGSRLALVLNLPQQDFTSLMDVLQQQELITWRRI